MFIANKRWDLGGEMTNVSAPDLDSKCKKKKKRYGGTYHSSRASMTSFHLIELNAFFMSILTATQKYPLFTSSATVFCSFCTASSVARIFLKPY